MNAIDLENMYLRQRLNHAKPTVPTVSKKDTRLAV